MTDEQKAASNAKREATRDAKKVNNVRDEPSQMMMPPPRETTIAMWNVIKPIAEKHGSRLFLAEQVLNNEHGSRNGKMGTKSTEEDMWTTAFNREGIRCPLPSTLTQADCGILCPNPTPLSIKCSKTTIAVNWGKNKTKTEFVFEAAIMLIWHGKTGAGVYIVDPAWCQANITLGGNNKTDYAISGRQVTIMRKYAAAHGMFAPLTPLPDSEKYFIFRNGEVGYAWPRLLSDVAPEIA